LIEFYVRIFALAIIFPIIHNINKCAPLYAGGIRIFGSTVGWLTRRPKLKLAAGIIFFNDCHSLKRCLGSLVDEVDMIFAVDGKFPNFSADSKLSTDGSREVVRSYSKCLLIDFPGSEYEKRAIYLKYCSVYSIDILLIIDSDEFILNNPNWDLFRHNLKRIIFDRDKCSHNVYAVRVQTSVKDGKFLPYPRIWYKPGDMEYYGGRHYFYKNKDPLVINVPHQGDHSLNIIEGVELGHNHFLRSEIHMKSRFAYQYWLQNFENSLPQ
jgi:hypothetical protein